MAMKSTNELEGYELDYAVAIALGMSRYSHDRRLGWDADGILLPDEEWQPSTDWHDGGPLIESNFIELDVGFDGGERFWMAACHHIGDRNASFDLSEAVSDGFPSDGHGDGPTPLIAAMRAFVTYRLGLEIDVRIMRHE